MWLWAERCIRKSRARPGQTSTPSIRAIPTTTWPTRSRSPKSADLSRILGKPILSVNSLHHQAIGKIGAGVRATALAPDGVVEAIEVEDHPFGLGVQWHPEAMLHHPEMQSLFDGFVAACRK